MEPLRLASIVVFGAAALLCLGLLPRTRVVSDPDTRRGLAGLLTISGAWAGVAALRVVVPSAPAKLGLYVVGLAVGLAAVVAWLAFCSAYAGRQFHRDPRLGAVAVAVYLLVVGVKFTNPIHGQYFTATLVATPFPHLAIDRLALDWVVTAAAYVASGYGFYLLYGALSDADYDAGSLWLVVGLAALPVVPSLLLTGLEGVPEFNYEPVGVALFAVGALYFTEEKFTSVGRYGYVTAFDDLGEAVVVVDAEGRVRRTNRSAVSAFPALDGAEGEFVEAVVPALAAPADSDVVTVDGADGERHLVCRTTPLSVGGTDIGTVVVLTDVTEIERKRRELERQNDQLDDFAAAIDHELRNTVGIAAGYTELARDRLDDDDAATDDALAVVDETLERMRGVSEDLATLARHGQTVSRTAPCDLASAARRAWRTMGEADATLELGVDADDRIVADEARLVDLFAAAFDFAVIEGATRARVDLDGGTLVVTADCDPVPADRIERAFAYDAAVPSAEAGMLLPNVRTLAAVHGWSVDLDPTYRAGVRLEISGVEPGPSPERAGDSTGRTSQRT